MSDGHDPLTVDFIRLVTVDPLSKRDAAKPEEKECYEAEKDSYDCDHSYPPDIYGLLPSCQEGADRNSVNLKAGLNISDTIDGVNSFKQSFCREGTCW